MRKLLLVIAMLFAVQPIVTNAAPISGSATVNSAGTKLKALHINYGLLNRVEFPAEETEMTFSLDVKVGELFAIRVRLDEETIPSVSLYDEQMAELLVSTEADGLTFLDAEGKNLSLVQLPDFNVNYDGRYYIKVLRQNSDDSSRLVISVIEAKSKSFSSEFSLSADKPVYTVALDLNANDTIYVTKTGGPGTIMVIMYTPTEEYFQPNDRTADKQAFRVRFGGRYLLFFTTMMDIMGNNSQTHQIDVVFNPS